VRLGSGRSGNGTCTAPWQALAALAPWALYRAAALDLALGVLTLMHPRRWLWRSQAALILAYSAIVRLRLPEYWLHPFGPVQKNLPMLVALLVVFWPMVAEPT
jgi:hypothetical protein